MSLGMNTVAGSFGSAWNAMTFGMPLIMFMQAIGASGVVIGLVTTVRLLAVSGQILGALGSEQLRARKPFWGRMALVHRSLWFLIAALAFFCTREQWWLSIAIVGVVGASELLGNASAAPWLSWMAELIPTPIAGRFWGIRQSVSTAAALGGLALAGQILDATRNARTGEAQPRGFATVFAIAACVGIADIVVHHFVLEPRPTPTPQGAALRERIMAPFGNRDFRLLTYSLAVWNFGFSMTTAFAFVYLKRDFNVTYSQLAAIGIAAALGAILTGFHFGQAMDRMGARAFAGILLLTTPLTLAPWLMVNHGTLTVGPFSFPQSIALLSAASVAGGAVSAAIILCQYRLAAELTLPQGRTMSMAVHWTFVSILGALGPTAGGLVMDYFPRRLDLRIPSGLPFSFFHAQLILFTLLLWLVALPLLMAIRPADAASPR